MKHLANQNGRLDGVSGILLWSTTRARSCRPPFVDGGLGKPDREVAAPTQGIVVLGPVGHLVSWLGELVAAALTVFVGHLLFMSVKSNHIMPFRQNGGRLPIYATTPVRCMNDRKDVFYRQHVVRLPLPASVPFDASCRKFFYRGRSYSFQSTSFETRRTRRFLMRTICRTSRNGPAVRSKSDIIRRSATIPWRTPYLWLFIGLSTRPHSTTAKRAAASMQVRLSQTSKPKRGRASSSASRSAIRPRRSIRSPEMYSIS